MEELYIKPSRLTSKKAKYSTKKRKKSATLNPNERAKGKHPTYIPESYTPYCRNCGEHLIGDGYTSVMQCPYTEEDTLSMEPDYGPVFCDFEEE